MATWLLCIRCATSTARMRSMPLKPANCGKASELFGGLITQQLKALAATRNILITSHGQFFDFLRQLSSETREAALYKDFVALNALHRNFYDETIPPDVFPDYYEKAIQYIARMDRLARTAPRITTPNYNRAKQNLQLTSGVSPLHWARCIFRACRIINPAGESDDRRSVPCKRSRREESPDSHSPQLARVSDYRATRLVTPGGCVLQLAQASKQNAATESATEN